MMLMTPKIGSCYTGSATAGEKSRVKFQSINIQHELIINKVIRLFGVSLKSVKTQSEQDLLMLIKVPKIEISQLMSQDLCSPQSVKSI